MPKVAYIDKRFTTATAGIIVQAIDIVEEYVAKGFDLTLRQLYYQFVARGLMENQQRNYHRLVGIISNARLAGYIDWNHIVDRTRMLRGIPTVGGTRETLRNACKNHAIDLWKGQLLRPEVWIEKDALTGVIAGPCNKERVDYFSCRGYISQSSLWRAARRIKNRYRRLEQGTVILHFGDHDPSGVDMTRDIEDRLNTFNCEDKVYVVRIALTMKQIREHNPPPNPTKVTDSRSPEYIKKYGVESWELDALDPETMADLIHVNVATCRTKMDRWDKQVEKEVEQERNLKLVEQQWKRVVKYINRKRERL